MSLRFRLLLTHVFVILLTLVLVTVSLVLVLRTYQQQIQLARLSDILVPLSFTARGMLENDVPPRDAVTRLEQQIGSVGRVMIVTDKGLVLADAAYGLTGRDVRLNRLGNPQRDFVWGNYVIKGRAGERNLLFVGIPAGQVKGQNVYVVLSSQERPLLTALMQILPNLLVVGLITLVISLLTALLLARSIAKPISRLTSATQAFAQGHYEHRVNATGSDEIGKLGQSFNTMAERVQRSRQMEKDFVANVSHELKTPLTSIQGFSQAILDGAVPDLDGAKRAAKTIFDEASRMALLVGDLLTIARFESGEMPLAKEKLDLAQLIPCWVDRLQSRAQSLDETLTTIVDPLPTVWGDAGKLEQVITNLVDNALKYNHAGGAVTVTAKAPPAPSPAKSSVISLRRAAQTIGMRWVTISVADTGAGIPKEDLPRLFERFYRGDKARVAGGTGLGLSIVNEIIEAHGGKITVQSEPGKGSVFLIYLPVQDGNSQGRSN